MSLQICQKPLALLKNTKLVYFIHLKQVDNILALIFKVT